VLTVSELRNVKVEVVEEDEESCEEESIEDFVNMVMFSRP